jgi:AAA15 family ATPase/GTPase
MEIRSFRIENFRSIRDTGWQPLSTDNITVLVGQNESGKSSILDALELGYCITPNINPDDFRLEGSLPRVSLKCSVDNDLIEDVVHTQPEEYRDPLIKEFGKLKEIVVVSRIISENGQYRREFSLSDDLMALFAPLIAPTEIVASKEEHEESSDDSSSSENEETINYREEFIEELWRFVPEFILFRESTCSLPNRIDILKGALVKDAGTRGASNFISASGLEMETVLSADHRKRDAVLSKASAAVSRDLERFWSQLLGRTDKITLSCELKHHAASETGKAGLPYLAFWVKEGDQLLYPSQRSRGTRWFISFFLELSAGNKKYPGRVVLLDEPANFLHPSAQKDVIKLLEKLAVETKIIYSTHSPYMLEQGSLHRILAVEREADDDTYESVTVVRRGLELASASQLTLAPILTLIGVDLSHQQVIKRTRNVILEEISARYYILAFVKLLGLDTEVNLVACGGVDTVKTLVDLFIAWGIKFTVLVDDDSHGKRVVRDIKAKYQIENDEAAKILQTISDCEGVEDLFSKDDFLKHVLGGQDSYEARNSTHVKKMASKPMLALAFNQKVMRGEIVLKDLSEETTYKMKQMISRLFESLDFHKI